MSSNQTNNRNNSPAPADTFELSSFFPYEVRVFYSHVTQAVVEACTSEHDMSAPEWRTMSIVGPNHALTSVEVTERSSMDKVTVSRAVARLKQRGWLVMNNNTSDARSKLLTLSSSGRTVYRQVVPKVIAAEKNLLNSLSESEVATLRRLMKKVTGKPGSL